MIHPSKAVLWWSPVAAPGECVCSHVDHHWPAYAKHDGATRKQWHRLTTAMQIQALKVIGEMAVEAGTPKEAVARELAKVEGMA